ncbi:MAG: hypothetical protein LUC83_10120, partial [Clostridiales bacterium]|nr:hypothetical protein [Clostridiales bacterium]
MSRIWKESLKRGMAGLLAFAMASLLVVGDTGIAFADFASDGLLRDGLSLSEDRDVSGSVVDGVTFENQERDGVLISVSSETSDFQPGDDVTLHIYVKNESDQVVTDGMLSYEGDGIQKGSGDLALLGRIDGRDLFAGSDGMEDADLIWDLDENSAKDILETERDGITLEPGEICAAQFTYVVDKSVDEKTAETFQIDFRFEGVGEDGDAVEAEETFSFNVNYLNVAAPEFEDGNRVKTGETVTMGIHADLAQTDAVLTDSWEDASASDAKEVEADETVATPSQADAATSSAERTATASNALASSVTVSVATPSQAGAARKATTSNAVASDSDADETDSSADEELIDDRETTLTPVDLSEVRYEVEMYNAKLHGFQAKKAMVDDADNNMLICTYRVSPEVKPGIYFGKITQISETNGRTYESTQGFALIVEGEGNVTLEGRLGHTTVTVSGPVDAFPDADDLEVRVTELDEETQAKVEEAIRRKADEDGETIENYIAVDVSLYANGEEFQPGERVN